MTFSLSLPSFLVVNRMKPDRELVTNSFYTMHGKGFTASL